ncbi:MAG: mechanosensitive ion channel [Oleibacter sp.]|nr:mechanosensitive ion channel [Thalassolituus sp.]
MQQTFERAMAVWGSDAGLALIGIVAGFAFYKLLAFLIARCTKPDSATRLFFDAAAGSIGVSLCLAALNAVLHSVQQDLPLLETIQRITILLLILSITWAAVKCTSAIGEVIVKMNPAFEDEWKRARKVETQTRFLVRCLNVVIVLVGVGSALMTFDSVNQIGTSLLASAGVGGIILGFAARPVLSNLLAGMQIALTQPFRIDDVLFVEDQWCWVEEVTATYVVVRVWDLRRLVIPLQWFIENPFQNWSRHTTELMGTVFIWVDYGMPIDPLRNEFLRLIGDSPLWNGTTATVQVVDSGEKAIQIRFLMSAKNSNTLWDLRCYMRESMISYVQTQYPQYLPRFRAQMLEDDGEPGLGAAPPPPSSEFSQR